MFEKLGFLVPTKTVSNFDFGVFKILSHSDMLEFSIRALLFGQLHGMSNRQGHAFFPNFTRNATNTSHKAPTNS